MESATAEETEESIVSPIDSTRSERMEVIREHIPIEPTEGMNLLEWVIWRWISSIESSLSWWNKTSTEFPVVGWCGFSVGFSGIGYVW